jgi:hypothetical protein
MPQLMETAVTVMARIETAYPLSVVADILSSVPAPPPTSIGTTIDLSMLPGEPAQAPVGDADRNAVDHDLGHYLKLSPIPKAHLMEGHRSGFGGLGEDEMEREHLPMCLAQEDGIIGVMHG